MTRLHTQLLEAHRSALSCQSLALESYIAACEEAQRLILQEVERRRRQGPTAPTGDHHVPPDAMICRWEMNVTSDPWVVDHAPAYLVPVLPLTYELDMMCRAAAPRFPEPRVVNVVSMESRRWASFPDGSLRGRTIVRPGKGGLVDVDLQVESQQGSGDSAMCATARLSFARAYTEPPAEIAIPELIDATEPADPYGAGALFHGPSLQLMTSLVTGRNGASCRVQAESRGVPYGEVHPGLLDASLHCVPFFEIGRWYPEIAGDKVGFPYRIRSLTFYRGLPRAGFVEVHVRRLRIDHDTFPVLNFWLRDETGPIATFELTIALMPMGPLAGHDFASLRRFLRQVGAVKGLTLTKPAGSGRVLHLPDLQTLDWVPGSMAHVYGLVEGMDRYAERLAIADHLGHELALHPSKIVVDDCSGLCKNLPLNDLTVTVNSHPDRVETTLHGPSALNVRRPQDYWSKLGVPVNLLTDVVKALGQKVVRRVVLQDPVQYDRFAGQPVLYLANHQTGIESLPFCITAVFLGKTPCRAVTTRAQQEEGILGALYRVTEQAFGPKLPFRLMTFDKKKRESLLRLLGEYREAAASEKASLYVAVEGQRAYQAEHEVATVSSVFIDLAISENLPIIPVKFVGGLPQETLPERLDFPYRLGGQDYYLGAALWPPALAALPYGERPRYVARHINELGPELQHETPIPPDPDFIRRVSSLAGAGLGELPALVIESLRDLEDPSEQTREFLQNLDAGRLPTGEQHPLVQALWSLAHRG